METIAKKPFAKIVKNILDFRQNGTVLDVGTGDGQHALFLASQGFEVTILDTSDEKFKKIIELATTQGIQISSVVGDVLALHTLGKSFDIVVCTSVLHFLTADKIAMAIEQLKAVTHQNGINVVSAHTINNEGEVRPHFFAEGELKKYYEDWNILYEWEGLGGPFETKTGEVIQRHRTELIAENK